MIDSYLALLKICSLLSLNMCGGGKYLLMSKSVSHPCPTKIGIGPCHHGTLLSFISWWSGSSLISTALWKLLQIPQYSSYDQGLHCIRSVYSLTSILSLQCFSRKKTHMLEASVFVSIHPEKSDWLRVCQLGIKILAKKRRLSCYLKTL